VESSGGEYKNRPLNGVETRCDSTIPKSALIGTGYHLECLCCSTP